jgi:hypothetical protein
MTQYKTLLGAIAVSLSHLLSAAEKNLHDDQQAAVTDAIVKLRDAETQMQADIQAMVNDEVDKSIADRIKTLGADNAAQIDGLSARIDANDAALKDIQDGLTDLQASIDAQGGATPASSPAVDPTKPVDPSTPVDGSPSTAAGISAGNGTDVAGSNLDSSGRATDNANVPVAGAPLNPAEANAAAAVSQEGDISAPDSAPPTTITVDPDEQPIVSETPIVGTGEQPVTDPAIIASEMDRRFAHPEVTDGGTITQGGTDGPVVL